MVDYKKPRRINRNRFMKVYAYTILCLLVVVGFALGRITAPAEVITETVTITEVLEVPVYESQKLPEVSDIFLFDIPLSESLQRFIHEVSADEKVPVTLVLAMIEHESRFNADAVSATDDYGLMQINVINHEWLEEQYRCADMMNPYQNVFCGVKIIGRFVEKYEGDYNRALMSYNMGDYGARKAWENGVESTRYSTSILSLMQKYEKELNQEGDTEND